MSTPHPTLTASSQRPTGTRLWVIVLVLLLATALRAWNLDAQSLWFDEGFSWHVATQPTLLDTWTVDRHTTNPALYHALLHVWVRLVGDSEFGLRSLTLLEGVLLLALMGAAGRRWFGRRVGLLAMALGAFSPLLWWASQEARMYNTMALAVLVMALGALRLLDDDRPPRWAWAAALGGELAALYAHNTGVVVAGAVNTTVLLLWATQIRRSGVRWRWLLGWVIGQGVIVLLWLPEYVARFVNVGGANAATASPPQLSLDLLAQSWQGLWAGSWEMVRLHSADFAWLLLPLGLVGLLAQRRRTGRRVCLLIAALYATLIAALMVLGVDFHSRYLVMIAPLLLLVMAAGAAQIRLGRLRPGHVGAVMVAAAAFTWLLVPGQPRSIYQHDDARAMVDYYARQLGPQDRILSWSYAKRWDLLYYLERHGMAGQLVTLPDGSGDDTVLGIVNAALPAGEAVRVELNTWFTQRANWGLLGCLIGHGQPAPTDTFRVQGMVSEAYTVSAPLNRPTVPLIEGVDFGPLRLDGAFRPIGEVQANARACLTFIFTLQEAVDADYSISVEALNPLGNSFFEPDHVQADAVLYDTALASTSLLEAGAQVRASVLLAFPTGTPPGDYPLRLRAYDAASLRELDVRDPASNAPAGTVAALASLPLSPGSWPLVGDGCAFDAAPDLRLVNCDTGRFSEGEDVSCPMNAAAEPDSAQCAAFGPDEISAGQPLDLTLHWQIDGAPPPITLRLQGEGWEATDTATPPVSGDVLDWRRLSVPAEAADTATLWLQVDDGEAQAVKTYTLVTPEHLMQPPPVTAQSGVHFPGLGTLYGYSLDTESIHSGEPLALELVWQADGSVATAYTVTVQLLDDSGTLLAQHDSQPANGARPTTDWIAGEYIRDAHSLTFRPEHSGYSGGARLIVAVYDPQTNVRLWPSERADYVELTNRIGILP